MSTLPPAAILTSVEGATTPPGFPRDVLAPFFRARLPELVGGAEGDPAVAAALDEVARMVPGQPVLTTLLHWVDQGAATAPLQSLQDRVWQDLFARHPPDTAIYADVPACLRLWARMGLRLYAFSTVPAEVARLVLGRAPAGDLAGLFAGFFDPRVGGRRDPDSYIRLAIGMNVPTVEVLFLSAVEAELDAAAVAGMRTCQVLRPLAGLVASERHPVAADFPAVARALGLPIPR
ncbi:MAG: 2,3-diketo-5-methylthio-1-phosphopentane phosphatase [Rhodospirillales bacterium 70-18]|nr:MAG: 2,3-diketo-5-methylthio-1-phosphopentane phosphatase [Rhodospirillales bacterium 70-18]